VIVSDCEWCWRGRGVGADVVLVGDPSGGRVIVLAGGWVGRASGKPKIPFVICNFLFFIFYFYFKFKFKF
jgi:hypothetical protein